MKFVLCLFLIFPLHVFACLPSEVHIREQWINSYTKENGVKVSAHLRTEHCRKIDKNNYFQNSTAQEISGLKTKFKSWTKNEKLLFNNEIEKLPVWLKKYAVAEALRADTHAGNPTNPAITIPSSKTLILFDKFFTMPNKREILIHEFAHIAVWDIDPLNLQDFFVSRGWKYEKGKLPIPPEKVVTPDSSESPSEDFANSVELYYSNIQRLKDFNIKSFLILENIIKSKEKQ